jgi:hypothetical protein
MLHNRIASLAHAYSWIYAVVGLVRDSGKATLKVAQPDLLFSTQGDPMGSNGGT